MEARRRGRQDASDGDGQAGADGARLFVATSPTRDFRKATWAAAPATIDKETVTGLVDPPTDGCEAFFGVLDYEIDGIKYHLCTQMRVAGAPKP